MYEAETGETPEATLKRLTDDRRDVAAWVKQKPNLGRDSRLGPGRRHARPDPDLASPRPVVAVTRGYGNGQKPADFLDSFTAFIKGNVNKIAALTIVVQRPRDLTRAELKALRLALDGRATPKQISGAPGRRRRTRISPPRSSASCGRPPSGMR